MNSSSADILWSDGSVQVIRWHERSEVLWSSPFTVCTGLALERSADVVPSPGGRTSAGMISTAMTRDTFHLHLEFLKATAHLTVCVKDTHCAKVSVLWWFCASLNHNLAYILKVRCEVWKKYEDCPSETERCDFKKENILKKKRKRKKKMNNKKEPPGDSIVQDLESCRKDMELLVCIRYRCSGCNVCQWRGGDPTVTVLVFWVCRGEQIFRALVPQLWLMSDRGMRCYDNWHATGSDGGNWLNLMN